MATIKPKTPRLKRQMVAYAKAQGIKVPSINVRSRVWGAGARRLAWRISKAKPGMRARTGKTRALCTLVGAPCLVIREVRYKWNGSLGRRRGKPRRIVWHHEAGSGQSVQQIHAYHRSLGWLGIAYHLYVDFAGTCWRCRPLWAIGGHAKGAGDCIGVCAEGNYETRKTMPAAQKRTLRAVHDYLGDKYGVRDVRHKDMPGNATACPGKHFPFANITGG